MRPTLFVLAVLLPTCGLGACTSTGSGSGGSEFSRTFDPSNYRQSSDTNGTQTRPDVNRIYTQPTLPSIMNRGN